jgi:hypothetical protein
MTRYVLEALIRRPEIRGFYVLNQIFWMGNTTAAAPVDGASVHRAI